MFACTAKTPYANLIERKARGLSGCFLVCFVHESMAGPVTLHTYKYIQNIDLSTLTYKKGCSQGLFFPRTHLIPFLGPSGSDGGRTGA